MAGRYSRLYSLPENLYIEGAPVIVSAGALLKDNQIGKVLAQLKFKNITPKIIKAIKVSVDAYDVSGVKLQGVDEYQYLDLAAKRDDFFGSKTAFPLPDNVTRSFTVNVKSVIFSDGSTWENTGVEIHPLVEQHKTDATLGNLAQQYKRDTDSTTNRLITEDRDLWICRCDAINKASEDVCYKCGTEKALLLNALDLELLKQHKAEHDAAEAKAEAERLAREEEARIERERKAEEDKIRAAANKKKAKKIAAIVLPSIVAVAAIVILTITVFIPNSKYNDAVALMNAGQYEEAIVAFEAMDGYKDSVAQITECQYLKAIVMMNNGDYEDAIAVFAEIVDHKDSAEQIEQCKIGVYGDKYATAVELMNGGEFDAAIELFLDMGAVDMVNKSYYLKAKSLADSGYYIEAYTIYERIKDYENVQAQMYIIAPCLADDYLQQEDYKNAVYWYEQANNIEKANEIMYSYVLEHYNNTDLITFEFLKTLKQRNYENAVSDYDNLYAIEIEMIANKSANDVTTNMSNTGFGSFYVHYRITGGAAGGEEVSVTITDPMGTQQDTVRTNSWRCIWVYSGDPNGSHIKIYATTQEYTISEELIVYHS